MAYSLSSFYTAPPQDSCNAHANYRPLLTLDVLLEVISLIHFSFFGFALFYNNYLINSHGIRQLMPPFPSLRLRCHVRVHLVDGHVGGHEGRVHGARSVAVHPVHHLNAREAVEAVVVKG